MAIIGTKEEHGDDRLTRIAQADTKKWYQKPELRFTYFILVPCGLGVEWTSGFDSSMMNSLQAVESWVDCMNCNFEHTSLVEADFVLRLRQSDIVSPRSA